MGYYEDVYLKRLNRFGYDYQSRIRQQRIKVFEDLLLKSIYRVDFEYDGQLEPGLLERYKQDDTQVLQYLLTRLTLNLNGGDILEITDIDGRTNYWMVYWMEYIETSGYNRYVVIKMSHTVKWTHELGKKDPVYFTQLGYFFGRQRLGMRDEKQSRARSGGLYLEDSTNHTLITPYNQELRKDDYLEIYQGDKKQQFRVTGFDISSTDGVEFLTLDPVYEYDKSEIPQQPEGDESNDYDWFTGNFKEV